MIKKLLSILLMVVLVIGLTGCSQSEEKLQQGEQETNKQTLVCTTIENSEGIEAERVVSMTYKEDKLNHMTMEVNLKINDFDVQKDWEDYKKYMNERHQEFNKDGVSFKIVVDNQNYKYNTILDIDFENATEEALKEQGFTKAMIDASTLEASEEAAREDGATCVIR